MNKNFQTRSGREEQPRGIVGQRNLTMNFLLRACACIMLVSGISSSYDVLAYNVDIEGDDHSAAHETMTEAGLDLYLYVAGEDQLKPHPFAQEIEDNWDWIRLGVTDPDIFDPLYGNDDDISGPTISHFFDADRDIGYPSTGAAPFLDSYANAFNAAQSLWTRALGEYAAGNKAGAYRFLGMIAHFLGDQSIPTHVHNDLHGPDWEDDDSFEEWMSHGTPSVQAPIQDGELYILQSQGLLEYPLLEPHNQLLWIFLNVNQVADYFGSDGEDGDANIPLGSYGSYAQAAIDSVDQACALEPSSCPRTEDRLTNNEGDPCFCGSWDDNVDNDLQVIRKHSYLNGVRGLGALFALWEEAISLPILNVTISKIEEKGAETLDDAFSGQADFYVGMVMGQNNRSSAELGALPGLVQITLNPPPGAYLKNFDHIFQTLSTKKINDHDYPANVTRYDATIHNSGVSWSEFGVDRHGTEDQKSISPNYHFGQVYRYKPDTDNYVVGNDIVNIELSVWEDDPNKDPFRQPYYEDELVDVETVEGKRDIDISVDLGKAASNTAGAVRIPNLTDVFACSFCGTTGSAYNIGQQITRAGGGEGGFLGVDDDATIIFSVSLAIPDTEPPEFSCEEPDGLWHPMDVSIHCTAFDESSPPADPEDFFLSTHVPDGTQTDDAFTDESEVCDAVGNCVTAGPIGGNMVDKKAPEITIVAPTVREYTHSEILVLDYTVTDDGSGVWNVIPTMNGSETIASSHLDNGQTIWLLTSLALGDNTFTVNADDKVNNASPPESVTFTIIVTPESIIDAVSQLRASGDIDQKSVNPLLAKLKNARRKWTQDQCTPAENMYGAFINHVQAQSGKSITPVAAGILIADAQYLITHCADGDLIGEITGAEADDDGKPASSELTYSLNSSSALDASEDPTLDGSTNLEEFLSQSDSNDLNSVQSDPPKSQGAGSMSGWIYTLMLFLMLAAKRRRVEALI